MVEITGGIPPYSFYWADDSLASLNRDSLYYGDYTLYVTDYLGNQTSTSPYVNDGTEIQVTESIANVTCNNGSNGSISISISQELTAIWADGHDGFNYVNLRVGVYSVVYENTLGCTLEHEYTLEEPTTLSLEIVDHKNISCFGPNSTHFGLTENTPRLSNLDP